MSENEPSNAKVSKHDLAPLIIVGGESVAAAVVAGTLTQGVGLVIGAATLPIFNHALGALVERRASSFRRQLEKAGFNDEALAERFRQSPELVELLSEATDAALKTDLERKHELLARVLASTVVTPDELARGWARRVVSAMGRIDVAEVQVLQLIEQGFVARAEIAKQLPIEDADAVDSVLAVLQSEGALFLDSESAKVSGFGRRILRELQMR